MRRLRWTSRETSSPTTTARIPRRAVQRGRKQCFAKMLLRVILCLGILLCASAFESRAHQVDVHLVTDEAEAVLAVLAKKRAKTPGKQGDLARVFSSEGYTRLK